MTAALSSLPRLLGRLPRVLRFALVGGAAAAVHLLVVFALVETLALQPLQANIIAFLVAFCVSYAGHALLTFADAGATARQSLPRFFAVAVSAFVCNEAMYYALLHGLGWPYLPALVLVLVVVAAGTYLASRLWAFAGGEA